MNGFRLPNAACLAGPSRAPQTPIRAIDSATLEILLAWLPCFDRQQRRKLNKGESNDVSTFPEFVWGRWILYGFIDMIKGMAVLECLTQSLNEYYLWHGVQE
jgi:hypothetical protein